MADIFPFKAVRPVRNLVHLVASRAYANYARKELGQKLDSNPYSFLHIINPDYGKGKVKLPQRFGLVGAKYREFKAKNFFVQDEQDSFYVYRQSKDDIRFTGIIGGASVSDYENDVIKKHESTLVEREKLFRDYLEVTGFNAEPVLLTMPDDPILDLILALRTAERPEYEFVTTDGILHELWLVNQSPEIKVVKDSFANYNAIYIADGHHRSASSALLAKTNKGELYQRFLAYFIPESQLRILPFHRMVKAHPLVPVAVMLSSLENDFTVSKIDGPVQPSVVGELVIYLEDSWYKLNWIPKDPDPSPVKHLDVSICSDYILKPFFGIADLRTDDRIAFAGGDYSLNDLQQKAAAPDCQALIVLHPVSISQLKAVADAGEVMPPKSTWIEPKLRSGLTIYEFN